MKFYSFKKFTTKLVYFDYNQHKLTQKIVRSDYVNSFHLWALYQAWAFNKHWNNQQKHPDEQTDCVNCQNCKNLLLSLNGKLIWKVFGLDVT